MRIFLSLVTCTLLCVAGFGPVSELRAAPPKSPIDDRAPRESPFVCDRLALDPAARARHFDELGPQLRALKTGVRELPNGYAFRFPSDMRTVQLVAEWAAGERLCCPFFDIDIRLEPEGGPTWLTITGREGAKRFIEVDAPDWLKR